MYFARLGFFEGPWEVRGLPGCEGYRISLASSGHSLEPGAQQEDGERAMRTITWWCFNDSVFAADPHVVGGLLEIHEAVRPFARHKRAEDLLREYGHREYLERVAEELQQAVQFGQLHLELLPEPRLLEWEQKPSEENEAERESPEETRYDELLVFKDGRARPVDGRLRYWIVNKDDDQQFRHGERPKRAGEIERFPTSAAQPLESALRYLNFKFDE